MALRPRRWNCVGRGQQCLPIWRSLPLAIWVEILLSQVSPRSQETQRWTPTPGRYSFFLRLGLLYLWTLTSDTGICRWCQQCMYHLRLSTEKWRICGSFLGEKALSVERSDSLSKQRIQIREVFLFSLLEMVKFSQWNVRNGGSGQGGMSCGSKSDI